MLGDELAFSATEPRDLFERWTARGIDPADVVVGSGGSIIPKSIPPRDAESLPQLDMDAGEVGAHVDLDQQRVIGQGAMGVVYAARQVPLRREVAVKMPLDGSCSLADRAHLLREARATGVLEHPNVVPVYLLGVDQRGSPVIVMKRIGGTPWSDLLRDPDSVRAFDESRDPLEFHLNVLMQVCNAVHYAHNKQILHRDLKPENVMIGEFGEVYVLDWGLAVSLDEHNDLDLPHASTINEVAGTPSYMPPEMVLADARRIGVRSDVYLLGAVLHEIVTGSPRHLGATLMEALGAALRSKPFAYGPNVPTGLASICNRATAAAIDERYESADALRLALAEFLRNRHSLQLSGAALARLAPLRMLVEEADPKDEDAEEELFSAFGECRFALQESLRQWPDNDEAKQGLQELLELMVARELAAEDYNAARRLLRELPKPCPALELRLGELRDKIDAERATVESLRNLGHRTDRSIGKRERALIMAAMAVIWTAIYFALGYLTRSGTLRATHETFMLVNVSYGVFLFIAMRVWKKTLWETEVNKRFLWTLWAAFAAGALFWPAARILQLPFGWSLAITMLLYATIVWMSAAAVDPRLIWVTPPYAVGFLAALAAPAYGWEVMGIATAVAMTTATLVWRPSSSGDTSSLPPLMGRSDPPGSRDGAR